MLFATTLLISLLFSIIELRGVNPRISRLLFYISSGLLFLLVAFNRLNSDYPGYSGSFYNGNDNHEIGFRLFNYFIKSIGLPFEAIMFSMGLLLLVTLILAARQFSSNLIVLYYLMFPIALDLPQMRNTFMYLIVISALLIFGHWNKFGFLIGIIAASTMHMLGILYTPLAFLMNCSREKFFKWLKILFIVLSVGAIGLRLLMMFTELHNEIAEEIDPFEWFYFAIQVIHSAIDAFTIWWIDRKIGHKLESIEKSRVESLYRFSWYSILYLPLVSLSTEMYRFRRNAQLVKYIYSAAAMKHLRTKDKAILIGLILLNVVFVIGMLAYTGDLKIYTYFDENWIVRMFS